MTSNAFITPLSATAQVIARTFWNNSLRAVAENFYGPAEPGPTNYVLEGDETQIPNGVLFRSSVTGALYVVDSVIQKNNPVHGGNYTRAGIAYRLEDTLALADFATYEIGEAMLTVGQSLANTRLYIKASNANEIVDIGLPFASSVTTAMIQTSAVTNVEIATDTIIATNIEDGSITNIKIQNIGVADGDLVQMDSTGYPAADGSQITNLGTGAPRGYIDGLILSNNGSDAAKDIDIATGVTRDDSNSADISLSSTLIKRLDAVWAVGTNQGGIDTGAVAADTWYHMWAIRRSDTEVSDILFSINAISPTMPTNYDQKRRIGAVLTNVSSNIIAFLQDGDRFIFDTPIEDENNTNPGTNAVLVIVSTPLGIKTRALFAFDLHDETPSADNFAILSDPDQADVDPTSSIYDLRAINFGGGDSYGSQNFEVMTDLSSQIRYRVHLSDSAIDAKIHLRGWTDPRGRNG